MGNSDSKYQNQKWKAQKVAEKFNVDVEECYMVLDSFRTKANTNGEPIQGGKRLRKVLREANTRLDNENKSFDLRAPMIYQILSTKARCDGPGFRYGDVNWEQLLVAYAVFTAGTIEQRAARVFFAIRAAYSANYDMRARNRDNFAVTKTTITPFLNFTVKAVKPVICASPNWKEKPISKQKNGFKLVTRKVVKKLRKDLFDGNRKAIHLVEWNEGAVQGDEFVTRFLNPTTLIDAVESTFVALKDYNL